MIEYKILRSESPINEEQLNELGKDGWTLVSVVSSDYWLAGVFLFYFIRNTEKVISDGQPTLACPGAGALIAIAQELKRHNDEDELERMRQERLQH